MPTSAALASPHSWESPPRLPSWCSPATWNRRASREPWPPPLGWEALLWSRRQLPFPPAHVSASLHLPRPQPARPPVPGSLPTPTKPPWPALPTPHAQPRVPDHRGYKGTPPPPPPELFQAEPSTERLSTHARPHPPTRLEVKAQGTGGLLAVRRSWCLRKGIASLSHPWESVPGWGVGTPSLHVQERTLCGLCPDFS